MTATQINVVSKGLFSPRWPVQGLVLTVFLCLPGAALLGTQLLFAGQNSGDDRALMWGDPIWHSYFRNDQFGHFGFFGGSPRHGRGARHSARLT